MQPQIAVSLKFGALRRPSPPSGGLTRRRSGPAPAYFFIAEFLLEDDLRRFQDGHSMVPRLIQGGPKMSQEGFKLATALLDMAALVGAAAAFL